MASFSTATRELVLKLVYYGPGLGGKTTTLKALHAGVRAEHRGKMISLTTPVDRTLYFDFLPVRLPSIGDLQLRLQLFTVPGQVYFNATRKLVLTGADGLVFVADSQSVRADANTESLDNLRSNLAEMGRVIESVPVVLAYNKRDLPDVLSVDELDQLLNPHGFPSLPTAADRGQGVFETLDVVVRLALDDLRSRRVIPPEVHVPDDGIIAERLADVREAEPSTDAPSQIIAGDGGARTMSVAMEAVVPPGALSDPHARPTPPAPRPREETPAPPPMSVPAVATSFAPSRRGTSFTPLFDAEDQETVRTIEDAISESILPRAVLLIEALLVRILERAGRALGRTDAPHEALAWTLGMSPERYTRLRAAAQRARHGGEISRRDALESYVTVATAQSGMRT